MKSDESRWLMLSNLATSIDRRVHASKPLAIFTLAILVAIATFTSVVLIPPYSVAGDLLIVLFFFMAAWFFGILGATIAWATALGVTGLMEPLLGLESSVNLANGLRGLFSALLFGLLFQMGRSLRTKQGALEASEARFRQLAQASFEGLVIAEGGKVIEANDHLLRIMRAPRTTLLGRDVAALFSPQDATRVLQYINEQDATPEPAPVEVTIRRDDGVPFDAEVIGRAITLHDRPALVLSIRDVTDRKKAEIALRRNERLSALGTLVAGVAHEINNPLAYVKGNVELMQLEAEDIAVAAPAARAPVQALIERSQVALEGLGRIAEITKNLKRVARSPSRVRSLEDMNRLVTNVLQVASGRIPTGVAVGLDLKATRSVMANGSEIAQILLNLIFNAGEAVGHDHGRIILRTLDAGPEVIVEVTDNGVGIPQDQHINVFTPFFTTKPQGTGLGLSVSRSIAKDHGGDLAFESAAGKGTTFRLTLPASKEVTPWNRRPAY